MYSYFLNGAKIYILPEQTDKTRQKNITDEVSQIRFQGFVSHI